jgi:hypothetical protein
MTLTSAKAVPMMGESLLEIDHKKEEKRIIPVVPAEQEVGHTYPCTRLLRDPITVQSCLYSAEIDFSLVPYASWTSTDSDLE